MDGDLLERGTALAAIDEVIEAARAGAGAVLLLEAHPGLGKTRLAEATAERGRTLDLRVLGAAGAALEQDLGWGVARGVFGPELGDRARREALLSGAAGAASALFAPGARPTGSSTAAILHGLYWLLSDLAAERPTVIVVDDVHWADAPSARWLAHLAPRVGDLPVSLLLTARPSPPSPYWQAIAAAPATRLLTLAPLSREGTRSLVAVQLDRPPDAPPDALADACHDATGGNPFLLGELLRNVASPDLAPPNPEQIRAVRPQSIRRAVLLRLAQLGEPATQLAFATAILGHHATVTLAAELASLPRPEAARAADALERADVIRIGPRMEFVHPLVLDVVLSEIPTAQRGAWHRDAVELLTERGIPAQELAPHLLATEPDGRADVVATLRAAAADALAVGAPETAMACLRRALEEPPAETERVDVLLELGRAEGMLAEPAGAQRLRDALVACDDAVKRGRITLELAGQLLVQGAIAEAVSACQTAADELPDDERDLRFELLAHARVAAGQDLLTAPEEPPGVDLDALTGATKGERMLLAAFSNAAVGGTWRQRALAAAGDAAPEADAGAMARMSEMSRRALGDTALLNDVTADGSQFWAATMTLMFGELYEEAERHIVDAVADSRRRGSPRGYGFCLCFGSSLRYRLGALTPAADDARGALEVFAGEPLMTAYALSFLLEALIDQGKESEARAALAALDVDALPPIAAFARLRACRGLLRRAEGDVAGAVDDLLIGGAQLGAASPVFLPWRADAALALHVAGQSDRASELAGEEVRRGERVSSRWVQARALYALAVVENTLQPLERAEALTRDWPTRLERARVLVALGGALSRRGRTREAIPRLRDGLDLADRCGATPIATEAREQLHAAGARPRRPRTTGRDALTPSELRVCRMASEGMSNRSIAQALFVSLRTVETHLTRSYVKLGVRRREELAQALRG